MANTNIRITLGTYDGWIYGWEPTAEKSVAAAATKDVDPSKQSLADMLNNASNKSVNGVRLDDGGMSLVYAYEAHVGIVRCAALMKSKNGNILATGGMDEIIRVYNLNKKREVGELVQHTGGITSLQFVGSKYLLSASEDKTVRIWRVKDWACLHVLGGHKDGITSLAVHPSGRLALSTSKDKTMRLWNLLEGRNAYISRMKTVPEKVVWSPSAEMYAILFRNEIYVYQSTNGEVVANINTKGSRIQDVLFLNDNVICYSSTFGILSLWNYVDETLSLQLNAGIKDRIRSLVKIDNRTILSVTTNGLVHVWDLKDDTLSNDTTPLYTLKSIAKTGSRTTCLDVCVLGGGSDDSNTKNNNGDEGVNNNDNAQSRKNNNNKKRRKKKNGKKRKQTGSNSNNDNNNNNNVKNYPNKKRL